MYQSPKLEFVVNQDVWFNSETRMADVILPVAIHAEQEGTYLSSAGQLGLLRPALPANGVRPDWQIILDLGRRLGFNLAYRNPAHIFQEMAGLMPLWAGLAPGLALPCPKAEAKVNGEFAAFDQDISLPGRRPLTLIIGKSLQHSGSFTTHAPSGTLLVTPEGLVHLNPEDAAGLELKEGEEAKVISSHGELTARVALSADLPPGVAFLPEHFASPAAHVLTHNSNLVRVTIQKA